MALDVDGARAAIEREVAAPLGLSVEEAAWGIHTIVNENMANAARVHAVERGKDPASLPLFAFGGAGPVHATGVARALGAPAVVAPRGAGVMSAFGFLTAPLAFDFVRSWRCELEDADLGEVNRFLEQMEAEGVALLGEAGLAPGQLTHERFADMRYVGQGHEVQVPLPAGELTDVGDLVERFEREYDRLYGRRGPRVPVEAITWRVVSSGPRPLLRSANGGAAAADEPLRGARRAYFPSLGGYVETPVYDRYALTAGFALTGPAVVEERESTLVVGPGDEAVVLDDLSVQVGVAG
jgi:N-methylhydantoinase A